jgi:hypothetical protein
MLQLNDSRDFFSMGLIPLLPLLFSPALLFLDESFPLLVFLILPLVFFWLPPPSLNEALPAFFSPLLLFVSLYF